MHAPRTSVFLFAVFVQCLPALAAGRITDIPDRTEYSHRIWRSEDGLPQNTIQAISQTAEGYLWIGTPEGLVRFDGVRFVVFDRSNTPAFQDDSILVLHPAKDGSLWIGSEGGGLLHLKNGAFRSYGVKDGLTNGFVRSIYIDHNGTLWVGADRGLFRMTGDRFERLDGTPRIPLLSVLSIAEDSARRLWVATQFELLTFDQGVLAKSRCPFATHAAQVQPLYASPSGVLRLITTSGLSQLKDNCTIPDPSVPRLAVSAVREDSAGNLWIGTIGQGLYRYGIGPVVHFDAPSILPENTVSAIFEDHEQNIWVGSRDGLLRLSRTAVTTLSSKDGLADENVSTVYQDRTGLYWIVTLTGQLYHYDGRRLERFRGITGDGNLRVRTILQDHSRALWIGTNSSGVIRISAGRTDTFTTRDGLRSNSIRQIFEDRKHNIWIATGSGLALWDGRRIRTYYLDDGLSYPSVRCVTSDLHGDILAGTDGGVNRIRNLQIVPDPVLAQLNREKIWAIHCDDENGIWLGSRGGGLFRVKGKKLTRFTTREGLLNDSIFQILEPPTPFHSGMKNKLWLSSPAGVFAIARGELDAIADGKPGAFHSVPYGTSDGMESSHMNGGTQPAGWVTASDELWFPSIRGVVRIDPAQLRPSHPMPVVIEKIVAGGRTIPLASEMTIPPGRGNLEIDYTACYLLAPQRVGFKYKLQGFEDDWNVASKSRSAHYTNVPPGHYTFRVMAGDSGTPGETSEASIAFTWSPAFYQTYWFYAICFVAAALVGWAALRLYTHQAKARYEVVLNERIRVAREMHDTVIQGCVGVSTLLEAATRFQRSDAGEAARLLDQAKVQVKATLDEARQAVWNLRNASVGQNAITTLSDLAGKLGQENGVKIETQVIGPTHTLEPAIDRTLLLVAREALRNSVLHAQAKRILMRITFQPSAVHLEVTDDGRGFESQHVLNSEDGHFGILGMQERVQQVGGDFLITSSPDQGTVVTARLPLA